MVARTQRDGVNQGGISQLVVQAPNGVERTVQNLKELGDELKKLHRRLGEVRDLKIQADGSLKWAFVVQVMDVCQKLLLLETTASSIQARGSIREADFLNQLCQKANCGLLLDVTALLVNSINHHYDPVEWLHQVDRRLILQLHVSGYSRRGNHCFDEHLSAVQEDVWNLVKEVLGYCSPRAIIIEREGNYPPIFAIEHELDRLKELSRPISWQIRE